MIIQGEVSHGKGLVSVGVGPRQGPGHRIKSVFDPGRCHVNCGGNWRMRRMAKPRAEGQKLDISSSWTEVSHAQRSSHWALEDTGIWDPPLGAVNASFDGPVEGS